MKHAVAYLFLSFLALIAWVVHQFGPDFLRDEFGVDFNPYYLDLPAVFWSTVLFTLFLGLAIEGLIRMARARRAEARR